MTNGGQWPAVVRHARLDILVNNMGLWRAPRLVRMAMEDGNCG
jgi:hypothetical protein